MSRIVAQARAGGVLIAQIGRQPVRRAAAASERMRRLALREKYATFSEFRRFANMAARDDGRSLSLGLSRPRRQKDWRRDVAFPNRLPRVVHGLQGPPPLERIRRVLGGAVKHLECQGAGLGVDRIAGQRPRCNTQRHPPLPPTTRRRNAQATKPQNSGMNPSSKAAL